MGVKRKYKNIKWRFKIFYIPPDWEKVWDAFGKVTKNDSRLDKYLENKTGSKSKRRSIAIRLLIENYLKSMGAKMEELKAEEPTNQPTEEETEEPEDEEEIETEEPNQEEIKEEKIENEE